MEGEVSTKSLQVEGASTARRSLFKFYPKVDVDRQLHGVLHVEERCDGITLR